MIILDEVNRNDYHKPVLLKESVDALIGSEDGFYADATFGGGGHSAEILSRLSDKGRLMAFDRDEDALKGAPEDSRFTLIHNNFRFIHNYTLLNAAQGLDGVLADLGVSSHQFDTAQRGFSFRFDAPLDMRMSNKEGTTAADIVNTLEENELARIFRIYGEVENAGRLSRLIAERRRTNRIMTTFELNEAIKEATPAFAEHKYLAKVYQALRIEVNQEMRSLEKFLEGAALSLKTGGRLVVITYHSLEDRMVKNFIKAGNIGGELQTDVFGRAQVPFKAVNRKPILPEESEIADNTRARSAKLRIAEKQ